jgi:hypothetical protein
VRLLEVVPGWRRWQGRKAAEGGGRVSHRMAGRVVAAGWLYAHAWADGMGSGTFCRQDSRGIWRHVEWRGLEAAVVRWRADYQGGTVSQRTVRAAVIFRFFSWSNLPTAIGRLYGRGRPTWSP